MAKLTRAEREALHAMFGGRCAYCGRDLPDRWHADHVHPVVRSPEDGRYGSQLKMLHPDRDNFENMVPACAPCNIDKRAMSPEAWRGWLATRLSALQKTPGWKLLESFGLVEATGADIAFHFERLALATREPSGETCHANRDGDCTWEGCPQLRDGHPEKSGRHCPLDTPNPERTQE